VLQTKKVIGNRPGSGFKSTLATIVRLHDYRLHSITFSTFRKFGFSILTISAQNASTWRYAPESESIYSRHDWENRFFKKEQVAFANNYHLSPIPFDFSTP